MLPSPPDIALFGGDARYGSDVPGLRTYPSSRTGGQGRIRSLLAAIGGGAISAVVILVRWVGHSERDAVHDACARAGLPCLDVPGGWSAARRSINSLSTPATAPSTQDIKEIRS